MPFKIDTIETDNLSVNGTQITENGGSPYKVYTALLTQSGEDNFQSISSGSLTIGVTYQIISASGDPGDFTNVGAPNNNLGTYFVATGTDPSEWGAYELEYNEGAPVVTVLENTIGDIWWTYVSVGFYLGTLNGAFTENKTFTLLTLRSGNVCILNGGRFTSDNEIAIGSNNPIDTNAINIDGVFQIEIRVYN